MPTSRQSPNSDAKLKLKAQFQAQFQHLYTALLTAIDTSLQEISIFTYNSESDHLVQNNEEAFYEDPIILTGLGITFLATLFAAYVVSVVNRMVWSRGGTLPLYYQ